VQRRTASKRLQYELDRQSIENGTFYPPAAWRGGRAEFSFSPCQAISERRRLRPNRSARRLASSPAASAWVGFSSITIAKRPESGQRSLFTRAVIHLHRLRSGVEFSDIAWPSERHSSEISSAEQSKSPCAASFRPWFSCLTIRDRLHASTHATCRRHGNGRSALLHLYSLSQRQTVCRSGPQPLEHRVDALGSGRKLS
jgi:hypothetical protein